MPVVEEPLDEVMTRDKVHKNEIMERQMRLIMNATYVDHRKLQNSTPNYNFITTLKPINMRAKSGGYQDVYFKRGNEMISLKKDVTDFCEKYIKEVHPKNWDWGSSKRDFVNPKNDPTIEEARAIRNVVFKDLNTKIPTSVDLSTINNVEAIKAYLNPKGKHEEYNMKEFASALKIELEHGRLKDVNLTNNHPFLTAMIALAHMSESLTYYKRLKVIEAEGKIFEIMRKLDNTRGNKAKWYKELAKVEKELIVSKKELAERLEKMDDIPSMKELGN